MPARVGILGDNASGAGGRVDWPGLDAQTETAQPARYLLGMPSPLTDGSGRHGRACVHCQIQGRALFVPFWMMNHLRGRAGERCLIRRNRVSIPVSGQPCCGRSRTRWRWHTAGAIRRTCELSGTRPRRFTSLEAAQRIVCWRRDHADATNPGLGPVEATAPGTCSSPWAIGAASGTVNAFVPFARRRRRS